MCLTFAQVVSTGGGAGGDGFALGAKLWPVSLGSSQPKIFATFSSTSLMLKGLVM